MTRSAQSMNTGIVHTTVRFARSPINWLICIFSMKISTFNLYTRKTVKFSSYLIITFIWFLIVDDSKDSLKDISLLRSFCERCSISFSSTYMYVCKMLLIYIIKLYIYIISYKCALSIIRLAFVLMLPAPELTQLYFIAKQLLRNR